MQDDDILFEVEEFLKQYGIDYKSAVEHLEDNFGLERSFLENLLINDDWSIIIKTHAFLEAAITEFLVSFFKEEKLKTIFEYCAIGNSKTGKIAFLEALDFINSDEKYFIRQFIELRNDVTHNIRNVNVNLKTYIENMDNQKRKNFVRAYSLWKVPRFPGINEQVYLRINGKIEEIVINNPRIGIVYNTTTLINRLFERLEKREEIKELSDHFQKRLDEFVKNSEQS